MREPTVATGLVRGAMEVAAARGAKRRELMSRARIDPEELRDDDNRIPLGKFMRLVREAKELCRDPAFALHFGEAIDISEMSLVGRISSESGTIDDDIALLNRYSPLALEIGEGKDRFRIERVGGLIWFIDTRPNPNLFPEITEMMFARAVCGMRRSFGETPIVKTVQVTHAAPAYRSEYDRIFRVPVFFESARNALLLSEEMWSILRNKAAPRYVSRVIRAKAETLLEELDRSRTTRGRVETQLMAILDTGEVSMISVANALGLSRQTLFRRLREEGTTFEIVLDALRYKLALNFLDGERGSIKEAAYRVGFSSPAAFSRAFKRWTGSSPRAYLSRRAPSS